MAAVVVVMAAVASAQSAPKAFKAKAAHHAKVDAVAKSAQEIETTVKTIETERRVEKAGMTRSDRLFMLLLNSAVAILVAVIFALTSAVNNPPLANTGPLIIGLLVVAIGLGWGANAGYAINPARDFGPRLASWITGYNDAWYSANGPELYFWLPIVAPLIGGLIGGALFVFCIERFLPAAVGNPAEIGVVEATQLR